MDPVAHRLIGGRREPDHAVVVKVDAKFVVIFLRRAERRRKVEGVAQRVRPHRRVRGRLLLVDEALKSGLGVVVHAKCHPKSTQFLVGLVRSSKPAIFMNFTKLHRSCTKKNLNKNKYF